MRIANRLLAFIVAVAVIVTGVTVIVEVIAARSGAEPVIIGWHSILNWGQRNTWKTTSVELACSIITVVGLLLLLPQLLAVRRGSAWIPAPPPRVPRSPAGASS